MTPEELEQTNRNSMIDECRRIGLALVSFAAGFLLWYLGVPLWLTLPIAFAVWIGLHMVIGIKIN